MEVEIHVLVAETLERIQRRFVADDLAEGGGIAFVADRCVERRRAHADGLQVSDLARRDLELDRELLVRRFAAELLGQRHRGAAHLGDLVDEMDGQADCLRLVRERAFDGLLDPPSGIGRELAALTGIEALHGLDEADVALADQVEQREAEVFIIHRDFHDEPEVGLDHVIASLLVAAADALRERDLLVDGQKRRLADLLEIKLEVAAVAMGHGFRGRALLFLQKRRRSIGHVKFSRHKSVEFLSGQGLGFEGHDCVMS